MFCHNCGKQIPDNTVFCPVCGSAQNFNTSFAQPMPPLAKVKKPIYTKWWFWVISVIVVIAVIGNLGGGSGSSDTAPSSNDLTASKEPTPSPTPTLSPEEQAALDAQAKADYIASCVSVNYKDLLRTPEQYIGTKLKITVQIQQIMDGGYGEVSAYRCYTDNSGYGYYFDDEYYIGDFRGESAEKLLNEDVIIVYGEYAGVTEVTRAMTGTTEEIPQINMYYSELISE